MGCTRSNTRTTRASCSSDFRVPAANLLKPVKGDGLTVAYHGLNLGRVALCANASGTMRLMLANMLPWARYRKTYGQAIASRELVERRLGRLAGLIVACDALVEWCAGLIDKGYRGEMECVIAKIFGSESQKEAAIELLMKTHGGRSFLHGHIFGDNVHEYLAPCIYEGEGEMLGMAFFKSLVKHHGTMFFEPIGKALHAAGIKKPNMANPAHAWALRGPLLAYAKWYAAQKMKRPTWSALPPMPEALKKHAEFAAAVAEPQPDGSQRHDAQASAWPGRPAMPHVRAVAARAGRDHHPLHVALCVAQPGRIGPRGGGLRLPGSDAQAHRRAPLGPLLSPSDEAGPGDRRRRVQEHRGPARSGNPHALQERLRAWVKKPSPSGRGQGEGEARERANDPRFASARRGFFGANGMRRSNLTPAQVRGQLIASFVSRRLPARACSGTTKVAKFAVIIPAAGASSRFNDPHYKKPFAPLADRAVWLHSAEKFLHRKDVVQLILVISPEDREYFDFKFSSNVAILGIDVVTGGKERADSVENALAKLKPEAEYVAVHDAARPCLADEWITKIFEAAERRGRGHPRAARQLDLEAREGGLEDRSHGAARRAVGSADAASFSPRDPARGLRPPRRISGH